MTYDITAHSPSDEEWAYLQRAAPWLAAGPDEYCPTCATFKIYYWQGQPHQCDCAVQLTLAQRYTLAGIPMNYQRLDWPDYVGEVDAEITRYRENMESFSQVGLGLFLMGGKGIGKTMLLTLLLKEFIRMGKRGFSIAFNDVTDQITAGWGPGEEARAARKAFDDRFIYTDVLLLDDLGKERISANTMTAKHFDNILRNRVQHDRVTLMSSNWGIDQLVVAYGEGVLSLLKEKSLAVSLQGGDFRNGLAERLAEQRVANQTRPIV
jgi:DNA replication protein DnaC